MTTTLLSDLLWSLATELADRRPEHWVTPDDEDGDDDLRRTIVAAINQHGWAPDGIPGLEPHVWRLHETGVIHLRSVFNGLPPLAFSEMKANPSNWCMPTEDANALRRRLIPERIESASSEDGMRDELDDCEHPLKAQLDRQESFKWTEGRYTLEEAAKALAAHAGVRQESMLQKLKVAAETQSIPTFEPGRVDRYRYRGDGNHVREFYEEVYWDNLNQWLDVEEPRISYRFPNPKGNTSELAADNTVLPALRSNEQSEEVVTDCTPIGEPNSPLQKQRWQEQQILRVIGELGYVATELPKPPSGRRGVKAEVRERLGWGSVNAFNKAWERLRDFKDIKDAES